MPPGRRSSNSNYSGDYDSADDTPEGSVMGDLMIIGFGILGLAVGLGLGALMAGAGRISIKAILLAVAGVFVGGAALVFGTVSLLVRILLPSVGAQGRSATALIGVLVLIVAIVVVGVRTGGFQDW